jgi:hypothetical protein
MSLCKRPEEDSCNESNTAVHEVLALVPGKGEVLIRVAASDVTLSIFLSVRGVIQATSRSHLDRKLQKL